MKAINTKIEKIDQAIKSARVKADSATKALKELEDKKKVLMATEIGDVLRDYSIKPQELRSLLESIKNTGTAESAKNGDSDDKGVDYGKVNAAEEEEYIPEPIVYEGVDYEG